MDTLVAEKYVFCLCSANGVAVRGWAGNHKDEKKAD